MTTAKKKAVKKTAKRTTAKKTVNKKLQKVPEVEKKVGREVARESVDDKQLTQFTGYSYDERALIKRMYGDFLTDTHIAELGQMAKATGLNTFVGEIYPIKHEDGRVIMFASRDGFRKLAKQTPEFVTCNAVEVRDGDNFVWGTVNNIVGVERHSFTPTSERVKKPVLGAYAIATVKRSGEISHVVEWVDYATYAKDEKAWKTHEVEMIKKVVEVHALKKVANISNLYIEEEFSIKRDQQGQAYIDSFTAIEDESYNEAKDMIEKSESIEELQNASEFMGTLKLKMNQKKTLSQAFIAKQQSLSGTINTDGK